MATESSDSQSMIKFAFAGVGALALAGLVFYLSRDETQQLDYKRYDKKKFQALMSEVQLELTCIYARNYNLLLKIKESGQQDDDLMDSLRHLINKETRDKQQQVVEDYCFKCHPNGCRDCQEKESITYQQFELWCEHFEDEPFMIKDRETMAKLDSDLFERQRIEHLSFEDEIPEELTAEKYLIMYKKIWAVLRHDLYKEIMAKKKANREDMLNEKDFDKLYEDMHKKFEDIRVEVYSFIMGDDNITQQKARSYMQKAYVNYSTISSSSKSTDKEVTRSRWPDLVHQVAQEHGKLIAEMQQGKFYQNIEKDPRESVLPDEKLDLTTIAGYTKGLSKQKTTIQDDKVYVRPVKAGADKYIQKMKELAQAAKKRVADRKAEAGETAAAAGGSATKDE